MNRAWELLLLNASFFQPSSAGVASLQPPPQGPPAPNTFFPSFQGSVCFLLYFVFQVIPPKVLIPPPASTLTSHSCSFSHLHAECPCKLSATWVLLLDLGPTSSPHRPHPRPWVLSSLETARDLGHAGQFNSPPVGALQPRKATSSELGRLSLLPCLSSEVVRPWAKDLSSLSHSNCNFLQFYHSLY